MEEFKYIEDYRHPKSACLNVTDDCVMRCGYCVLGNTQILMSNGTTKPIKKIQIGEEIIGVEENQVNKLNPQAKVLRISKRTTDKILKITTIDNQIINITPNHKLLTSIPGQMLWLEASNFKEKDLLCIYDEKNKYIFATSIATIEELEGEFEVYNIETECHTYIANGIVSHNCFVNQKPNYMTLDTAKDAVKWLAANVDYWRRQHNNPNETGNIAFFGGEPMIMFDAIIKPLVLWIEKNYPNYFHFNITTNAALLNEENIEFLYIHHIPPLISFDGIKKVQDVNRPLKSGESSYDIVVSKIPLLLEKFPNLTMRATLTQETINHFYESYYQAEQLGFTSVFFCPNSREKWTEENLEILKQEIHKIMLHRLLRFEEGGNPINFMNAVDFYKDLVITEAKRRANQLPNTCFSRNVVRCGLGTGSISVACNGDLYSCQEQDSRSDKYFNIGNIYNGIDEVAHSIILKDYAKEAEIKCEKPEKCGDCYLREMCLSFTCPSTSKDVFGDFFIKSEVDCVYLNTIALDSIFLLDYLTQDNNQAFKDYLEAILK